MSTSISVLPTKLKRRSRICVNTSQFSHIMYLKRHKIIQIPEQQSGLIREDCRNYNILTDMALCFLTFGLMGTHGWRQVHPWISSQDPMWASAGSLPCSRVPRHYSRGVLKPPHTTRTPSPPFSTDLNTLSSNLSDWKRIYSHRTVDGCRFLARLVSAELEIGNALGCSLPDLQVHDDLPLVHILGVNFHPVHSQRLQTHRTAPAWQLTSTRSRSVIFTASHGAWARKEKR